MSEDGMRGGLLGWWLVACNKEEAPPPVEERVLVGPAIGASVAVEGGWLWVSAPGLQGDGGLYGFDGPGGSLGAAPTALIAPEPLSVGSAFSICDFDGDSALDLVLGAPDRSPRGGAWWVHAGEDLSSASFVDGLHSDGRAGAMVACGPVGDETVVAISAPDTDGLGVAERGGSVGLHVEDAGQVDKIANLETSWSDSHLGFRSALSLRHDLDGDGIGDLAVGAAGAERVHLLFGPFQGSYVAATAGATLQGEARSSTGHALASGDFNGDGAHDLLIGAPATFGDTGAVWLVPGPFAPGDLLLRNLGWRRPGVQAKDQAGFSVASVPDVDGDGDDEALVGAPFAGGVGPEAGAAYLLLGPSDGDDDLDTADALFLGDVPLGKLGWSVAAGDIGNDGQIELVLGVPEADVGDALGVGTVYVFDGALRGVHYPEDALGAITR